jgi:hypothetical protein
MLSAKKCYIIIPEDGLRAGHVQRSAFTHANRARPALCLQATVAAFAYDARVGSIALAPIGSVQKPLFGTVVLTTPSR